MALDVSCVERKIRAKDVTIAQSPAVASQSNLGWLHNTLKSLIIAGVDQKKTYRSREHSKQRDCPRNMASHLCTGHLHIRHAGFPLASSFLLQEGPWMVEQKKQGNMVRSRGGIWLRIMAFCKSTDNKAGFVFSLQLPVSSFRESCPGIKYLPERRWKKYSR